MVAARGSEHCPSIARALGADNDWLCGALSRSIEVSAEPGHMPDPKALTAFARGLRRHLHVGHEILLPALEGRTNDPLQAAAIAAMREEHHRIQCALERVLHLVQEGDFELLRDELVVLQSVLEEHARLEEGLIYPACDRLLDPAIRVAAVRALDRKVTGTTLPPPP